MNKMDTTFQCKMQGHHAELANSYLKTTFVASAVHTPTDCKRDERYGVKN